MSDSDSDSDVSNQTETGLLDFSEFDLSQLDLSQYDLSQFGLSNFDFSLSKSSEANLGPVGWITHADRSAGPTNLPPNEGVLEALLPYLAMGWTPVEAGGGSTLECGLHALCTSYNIAVDWLKLPLNTGLQSRHVTAFLKPSFFRNLMDSDGYKEKVAAYCELTFGKKTVTEQGGYWNEDMIAQQASWVEELSEKRDLNHQSLWWLLELANDHFHTHFDLGVVTEGFWRPDGKPRPHTLEFTGDAPSNITGPSSRPVIWLWNDNAISRSQCRGESSSNNHWRAFGPPEYKAYHTERRYDRVLDWGLGKRMREDLSQEVYCVTRDCAITGLNPTNLRKGVFLRPFEQPDAGINEKKETHWHLRTCRDETQQHYWVPRDCIEKIVAHEKAPASQNEDASGPKCTDAQLSENAAAAATLKDASSQGDRSPEVCSIRQSQRVLKFFQIKQVGKIDKNSVESTPMVGNLDQFKEIREDDLVLDTGLTIEGGRIVVTIRGTRVEVDNRQILDLVDARTPWNFESAAPLGPVLRQVPGSELSDWTLGQVTAVCKLLEMSSGSDDTKLGQIFDVYNQVAQGLPLATVLDEHKFGDIHFSPGDVVRVLPEESSHDNLTGDTRRVINQEAQLGTISSKCLKMVDYAYHLVLSKIDLPDDMILPKNDISTSKDSSSDPVSSSDTGHAPPTFEEPLATQKVSDKPYTTPSNRKRKRPADDYEPSKKPRKDINDIDDLVKVKHEHNGRFPMTPPGLEHRKTSVELLVGSKELSENTLNFPPPSLKEEPQKSVPKVEEAATQEDVASKPRVRRSGRIAKKEAEASAARTLARKLEEDTKRAASEMKAPTTKAAAVKGKAGGKKKALATKGSKPTGVKKTPGKTATRSRTGYPRK